MMGTSLGSYGTVSEIFEIRGSIKISYFLHCGILYSLSLPGTLPGAFIPGQLSRGKSDPSPCFLEEVW